MDAVLRDLLDTLGLTPTDKLQPLSGGDIAAVYALTTRAKGKSLSNTTIPRDCLAKQRGCARSRGRALH